ncbi:MAG: TraB/GumN family protein [Clostridia bacterium]|nr:TraB/GumN family protein [Clostridia bacterium]
MKKTVMVSLVFIMLLSAAGQGMAEASPVLYRVTDGEGRALYLLGTIHVGKEDMYPLSDGVEAAYSASDVLAVEADVYEMTQSPLLALQFSMALMYTDGDTADRHLSPETYNLGVKNLGLPEAMLKRMRPMAWLSLAEERCYARVGLSSDWGIDMILLRRAHEDDKDIHELEGIDGQMQLMAALPEEACDDAIFQMLRDPEKADAEMLSLADAWAWGDAEAFARLIQEDMLDYPDEKAAAYQAYNEMLYDVRNEQFERQAIEYLQSGRTALLAVGAAHVIGENALADRLQKAGYTIEQIMQ